MKTKFLICGRSSSGKDMLTNYLCNDLGLKQLKSYTTRPMRYDNEDTHVFINHHESRLIKASQDIIAYTQIGDCEYFGTYEQLMQSDIYIVDPNGIKYLKNHCSTKLWEEDIQLVVIYIYVDDDTRASRAMQRCDDIRIYNQRCIDESEQFNECEDDMNFDWIVNNYDEGISKQDIRAIVMRYID